MNFEKQLASLQQEQRELVSKMTELTPEEKQRVSEISLEIINLLKMKDAQ